MRVVRKLVIPGPEFLAEVEADFKAVGSGIKIKATANGPEVTPTLWLEADPKNLKVQRHFKVVNTGTAIEDGWDHVATICADRFEMHVYVKSLTVLVMPGQN